MLELQSVKKTGGRSAVMKNAKDWMRPENMRWACYQWENKVHFRRMGGPHVPFWCNTRPIPRKELKQ